MEARAWASERGAKVVCRTVLDGHSGEGIVIARNPDQVVEAPLYSLYFNKVREFRVYVAAKVEDGAVTRCSVPYVASKRNPSAAPVQDRDDLLIRSGTKGWVYQVEDNDSVDDTGLGDVCLNFMDELVSAYHAADEYDRPHGWLLALDVVQAASGDTKIIEANMAPGLNEVTAPLIEQGVNDMLGITNE